MNFGERLKQLRTSQGMTQPQFAQVAGVEQSYLSKLENDKSAPSADMFATILAGLKMEAAAFLEPIDKEVLSGHLRHIPAVAQFTGAVAAREEHDTRRWLLGAAIAWVTGFALLLAANNGIFFSNRLYKYSSPGIVRDGEADDIFSSHAAISKLKLDAGILSFAEMSKQRAEFEENRVRTVEVEFPDSRGTVYVEKADRGHRRFALTHTEYVQAAGNRILQYIGAIVVACGFAALFVEWRLRRPRKKTPTVKK